MEDMPYIEICGLLVLFDLGAHVVISKFSGLGIYDAIHQPKTRNVFVISDFLN